MKKKQVLTLVQSFVLISSLLLSGCSHTASNPNTITTVAEQTTTSSETTTETTMETENYSFMWEDYLTEKFDTYVEKNFGINLRAYVVFFGFTQELNDIFTKFVNNYLGSNYKQVPFSKANYFYSYIYREKEHYLYRDYKRFSEHFFNNQRLIRSTFNNKLIMSYLISNNIRLGDMIPIDNLKSIFGNKIYTDEYNLYIIKSTDLGNRSSSYKYTNEDLFVSLVTYNNNLSLLFNDERIKTRKMDDCPDPEAIKIYNEHLKKFFGENAPQIGEVMTREKYIAIFGEEPLDLSYIPGAITKLPIVIANPDGSITEIK